MEVVVEVQLGVVEVEVSSWEHSTADLHHLRGHQNPVQRDLERNHVDQSEIAT